MPAQDLALHADTWVDGKKNMFFGIIFNEKVKHFKIIMKIIFCQHLDQLY